MINVYPLSQALRILQSRIEEAEGEITPDIAQAFAETYAERDSMLEALALLLKNTHSEMVAIEHELTRLRDLKFRIGMKTDRLEKMVRDILPTDDSWNHGAHKFNYRRSSAVEVEDGAELPATYYRIKTTRDVDKTKLSLDLKSGAQIKGASLATRYNLQVK